MLIEELKTMVRRIKITLGFTTLVNQQKLLVHVLNHLVQLDPVLYQLTHPRKVISTISCQAFLKRSHVSCQLSDELTHLDDPHLPVFCLKVELFHKALEYFLIHTPLKNLQQTF